LWKFQYIFWDFDGTLFDTYQHIVSIIEENMKSNYNIDVNAKRIENWCKNSMEYCFEKICSKFNIDKEKLSNEFSKNYMSSIESKQPPFPGAKEVLEYVHENGGKNFIVTHRGPISLAALLKYYNLEYLFEKNLTNADNFPKKPDPSSFLFLITQFNLPKERILTIGDREIDIQTARASDIKSCYFNPEGKICELADFNIKNLLELKAIVNPRLKESYF